MISPCISPFLSNLKLAGTGQNSPIVGNRGAVFGTCASDLVLIILFADELLQIVGVFLPVFSLIAISITDLCQWRNSRRGVLASCVCWGYGRLGFAEVTSALSKFA